MRSSEAMLEVSVTDSVAGTTTHLERGVDWFFTDRGLSAVWMRGKWGEVFRLCDAPRYTLHFLTVGEL